VLLLDERKVPGGQYYKQIAAPGADPMDDQQRDGKALLQDVRSAGVQILSQTEVWGAFDGPEIMATDPDCVYAITPRTVIVATGAYERPAMVPGWTLPGVMTVGAAQTLWRSYQTLPGRRVALFGNGPLTAQVALELAQGGAKIVLLGEAAPSPLIQPGAALSMMRADMPLAVKGIRMLAALRRKGVAVRHDCRPTSIEQNGDNLRVTYETNGKADHVEVDAVCMNFGFQPQNEILRLLGVGMQFDARFDQLRPNRSDTMETSVPGVYAIGDCCGLGGAPAAAVEGRIAGRAAAGGQGANAVDLSELKRHRAFQDALWKVYAAAPAQLETVAPETIVCRCEEITKGALDAALENGHTDIGAVKRATRVGMGRCQGRYCAPALAGYMARRTGADVQDLSFFAPRIPIKPVGIGTLVAAETLLDQDGADD
jgi:D-hydroxyproline dehydrogenase subunit alpha